MDRKREERQYVWLCFPLALILLLVSSSVGVQMASPNFRISTSVANSGGGVGSSAQFEMRNSTGQPTPTGISRSQHFGLCAGFQATTLEEFVLPTSGRGDVDGDGNVNVLDVLAVVNHILDTIPLEGDALARADCTADGQINVLDALGIVNVILGIGECEP